MSVVDPAFALAAPVLALVLPLPRKQHIGSVTGRRDVMADIWELDGVHRDKCHADPLELDVALVGVGHVGRALRDRER